MRRSIVIGRTNVGKTLFCIHFARYLGSRQLNWLLETTDGKNERVTMSLASAEARLSNSTPHQTRTLQSVTVKVPRGKVDRELLLTDTTGLSEGIYPDPDIRLAMAQTLEAMVSAALILHIVDADEIGRNLGPGQKGLPARSWSELDNQLVAYGGSHDNYFLLANKIDLSAAKRGYRQLCKEFSKHRVIPVSALAGTGFREVKQHVWNLV